MRFFLSLIKKKQILYRILTKIALFTIFRHLYEIKNYGYQDPEKFRKRSYFNYLRFHFPQNALHQINTPYNQTVVTGVMILNFTTMNHIISQPDQIQMTLLSKLDIYILGCHICR